MKGGGSGWMYGGAATLIVVCFSAPFFTSFLISCSSDSDANYLSGSNGSGSCEANSSGASAAGSYRCEGNTSFVVCNGGAWEYAGSCSCTVDVGDPRKPSYPTNCKSGSSVGTVVCSYAGTSCLSCSPEEGCH